MRILVDNGAYTLRNMGDVAMLQALLKRLRTRYAAAELFVLTSNSALLPRYCPGTVALTASARDAAYLPLQPQDRPRLLKDWWRRVRGKKTEGRPDPSLFRQVFNSADKIVVAGGGFLNDLNFNASFAILSMLAEAAEKGKPVALYSQGLGPMHNPELLALLGRAAKKGAWFGIREDKRGPHIALRAGAQNNRVAVTGDDAIESAWTSPKSNERRAIGFSMRQISYSGMEPAIAAMLGSALHKLVHSLETRAPVLPLPISFNDFEDDLSAILSVADVTMPSTPLDDPQALINTAGRCRVVVTGTYHAAVFALSQGVPAVCFFASDYYRDKLEGLADQFGEGCVLVDARTTDAADRLVKESQRLWTLAPALQQMLRSRAEAQIQAARGFFDRSSET